MNVGRFVAVWIFVGLLAVTGYGAWFFLNEGEMVLFGISCWAFAGLVYFTIAIARGEFDE
jgi:tellurite resistance protein TehA-like permease